MKLAWTLCLATTFALALPCLALAQNLRAWSLQEAARQAEAGVKSPELLELGGITRLVGFVTDGTDVVLVGASARGLEPARFEDLVVALRSRITLKTFPEVSIDPNPDSVKTGLQSVNFKGGLEDSAFGAASLAADVCLKDASLKRLLAENAPPSFRDLYGRYVAADLAAAGAKARGPVVWKDLAQAAPLLEQAVGKAAEQQRAAFAKFWFMAGTPTIAFRGGVYAIRDLRLTIQIQLSAGRDAAAEKAAGEFAAQFVEALPGLAEQEKDPTFRRLKTLFDLTAAADGISRLRDRPDLRFLLNEYRISPCKTERTHPLFQTVGTLDLEDGRQLLLEICGGVSFRDDIRWLNDGDFTPLRRIVFQSRPHADALSWNLPLDDWAIPNARDLPPVALKNGALQDSPGFGLAIQSFVLTGTAGATPLPNAPRFQSFPNPWTASNALQPAASSRDLGGVSLKMNVDEQSFQTDDSLNALRQKLLSRPSANGLPGPLPSQGGGQ